MPETIYASKYEKQALDEKSLVISVKDPDPQNPHVLGPQGSGSGTISQRYVSGSGSGFFPFLENSYKIGF
jgi:hypothetical protein